MIKFKDYYNKENIELSEKRITELLVKQIKLDEDILDTESWLPNRAIEEMRKFIFDQKQPYMLNEVIAYYNSKLKKENKDTALNMTLQNFWLTESTLIEFTSYLINNR